MQVGAILRKESVPRHRVSAHVDPSLREIAIRTAFVARFIVLREGRRSRAHRLIEKLTWKPETTAKELAQMIRQAFIDNGDKLQPVDRDLQRALKHAERSAGYFIEEYLTRASNSFEDALIDYEKSNRLLFGDDPKEVPRCGGWKLNSHKGDDNNGE